MFYLSSLDDKTNPMGQHLNIIDHISLPEGVAGITDGRTIWLNKNLTPAGRRCTLAHELIHIERGIPPEWAEAKEEIKVDKIASRRLTSHEELLDALLWHDGDDHRAALADTLNLDITMTNVRLKTVTPEETEQINAALANLREGE